jgi:hypothetical protein
MGDTQTRREQGDLKKLLTKIMGEGVVYTDGLHGGPTSRRNYKGYIKTRIHR